MSRVPQQHYAVASDTALLTLGPTAVRNIEQAAPAAIS